jgi:hypothetical protein
VEKVFIMEELITIDVLNSFAGATAIVLTATEILKKTAMLITPKKKMPDIVPILMALGTSLGVTIGTTIMAGTVTVVSIILAIVNGFAVFGSATGGYRAAKNRNPEI